MLKGVGKQIVVIKNPKSKLFEEAIFIIKDGTTTANTDILEECEKIIKTNSAIRQTGKISKIYLALFITSATSLALFIMLLIITIL